jgi:hypothetical protein
MQHSSFFYEIMSKIQRRFATVDWQNNQNNASNFYSKNGKCPLAAVLQENVYYCMR